LDTRPHDETTTQATDEAKNEIAALTELAQSPGWALVTKAFSSLASPAHVLDSAHGLLKDASALGSQKLEIGLRQILSEGSAVAAVLTFPQMRIAQLQGPKTGPQEPRGMPLPTPESRVRHFVRRG